MNLKTKMPRRLVLRQACAATALTGGMLVLAAGGAEAAQLSQAQVKYQTTPKGDHSCANCSKFITPSSCQIVAGTITPTGWCLFYNKKQKASGAG